MPQFSLHILCFERTISYLDGQTACQSHLTPVCEVYGYFDYFVKMTGNMIPSALIETTAVS